MIKSKLLVAMLAFTSGAWADDEVQRAQVPKPVLDALAVDFPRAQAIRFNLDSEDGQKIYEVKFREGRRKIKAEYTAEGKRLSVKGKADDDDDD